MGGEKGDSLAFGKVNFSFWFTFRSMDVDQLNPVDLNLINDLWVPNVFIYNLKTFKVSSQR